MIRHLFISPGHNYRGHFGGPAGEHPIVEIDAVECVAGRGIRGDRYWDFREDFKGQITFFSWEILQCLWEELAVPTERRDPAATRRNVLLEGVDLNAWIGREFELQGVRFFGTEECKPCLWMNEAIHPDAEKWMSGRGGLRAKILSDGILSRHVAPTLRLGGCLMAGGRSTRMGRDKARLLLGEGELWQRQLSLLKRWTDLTAIAAPEPPDWLPADARWVADQHDVDGPLGGLLAALEWAKNEQLSHLCVLAVDMPSITGEHWHSWHRVLVPGGGVIPCTSHGYEPLCAIYPTAAFPLVCDLAQRGERKLQTIAAHLVEAGLMKVWKLTESEEMTWHNLNTPEDWAAWRAE